MKPLFRGGRGCVPGRRALLAGGVLLALAAALPAAAQNQDLLAGVLPGADAASSGMSVKSQILSS